MVRRELTKFARSSGSSPEKDLFTPSPTPRAALTMPAPWPQQPPSSHDFEQLEGTTPPSFSPAPATTTLYPRYTYHYLSLAVGLLYSISFARPVRFPRTYLCVWARSVVVVGDKCWEMSRSPLSRR